MTNDIICPFCGDTNYDLVGLKHHLVYSCDKYVSTLSIIEERALIELVKNKEESNGTVIE